MARVLAGVLAPVITPFDVETGDIAPVSFRSNLRAHLDAGLHGLVVCGSTGEAALLSEREREQLIEWARPLVPDDRWLIVGTGGESTRGTVARCRSAQERGADAALVVAPHYYANAMTSEALVSHYRQVADESPIPLILYNIPKYMHFSLAPGLVQELTKHENIIGIKDSSGDLKGLAGYLEAQSDRFSVLTGHAGTFYAALELVVRGGILAASMFAPELCLGVRRAFASGERARAGALQERLTPLGRDIVAGLGVPGVKEAMDMVGLVGGPPRSPLLPLRAREHDQVAAVLRDAEVARAA